MVQANEEVARPGMGTTRLRRGCRKEDRSRRCTPLQFPSKSKQYEDGNRFVEGDKTERERCQKF